MGALAVVVPWYGRTLHGGAERQAREVARRLAARGHRVEVLTTCCRSFADDWSENHHPPGATREDGLTVRRFPVDARDREAFDRANAELLKVNADELRPGVCPVSDEAARDFVRHNINSSALVRHLRAEETRFGAFLFLPYLYGTTLAGLPAVAARALLQPCLHPEAYALLPAVAENFRRARRLLFNSEGELELARRLYGPGIHARALVVGEGVELFTADGGVDDQNVAPAAASDDDESPADRSVNDDSADRRVAGDSADRVGVDDSADRADGGDALPPELRGARFVLCLGRRDPAKNTDLLLRAFRRFRVEHGGGDLRLVLAGPGAGGFARAGAAAGGGVHDLGVVAEATKAALLRAALTLFQPSRNESFSRALMEAWLAGRPVAAHSLCPATALAVERAGGGWLAATEDEWAALFARVSRATRAQLDELGARGRAYARRHADWNTVLDRYEAALGNDNDERGTMKDEAGERDGSTVTGDRKDLSSSCHPSPVTVDDSSRSSFIVHRSSFHAVHQLLPDFVSGDAISNQALSIRAHLRAAGYESDIFAKRRESGSEAGGRLVDDGGVPADAALVYHHSIGSEVTAAAVAHRAPKCLVYHNVTPAEFFAPYRPGFAWLLETGRAQLPRLARHFPCSAGDSRFNADELAGAGFRDPGVLPIIVSPDKWNVAPDGRAARLLQDGRTNLLFVGRVAPNKRQDRLIEIFAEYVRRDADARLVVAGEGRVSDPYFQHLLRLVGRLRLRPRVIVTGRITDAELLACYQSAHLYLSASEHEGFGVPLVEAMWFDVPVLAARAGAVPDTVGDAGVLFDPGADLREVARLAKLLARDDEGLRRRVREAARARREAFTPRAVRPALAELLGRMSALGPARERAA